MKKPHAYTRIDLAPLDVYDGGDEGDARSGERHANVGDARTRSTAAAPVPIIPFTRVIGLGSIGKDVVGAKRAIWKCLGLPIPSRASRIFGLGAVRNLRRAQAKLGVRVDGQLGRVTLARLVEFFDDYAFFLYVGYPPGQTKEQHVRNGVVAYALWGYNNRDRIGYAKFRPMIFLDDLNHLPRSEDCSTFATKAHKAGGAVDPNGSLYDGWGNTSTIRAYGLAIPYSQAKPGDLLHYDDPEHVSIYVGDRRCVSHGSDPGPLLLPADYRTIVRVTRLST